MNEEHECIICTMIGYECDLYTLKMLEEEVNEDIEIYEQHKRLYPNSYITEPYTMLDYTDTDKKTNLIRFNYCPMCGKKIDWEELNKRYVGGGNT